MKDAASALGAALCDVDHDLNLDATQGRDQRSASALRLYACSRRRRGKQQSHTAAKPVGSDLSVFAEADYRAFVWAIRRAAQDVRQATTKDAK